MPESMFGRPSQLLPSHPPESTRTNPSKSDPQPPIAPLDFKDFRFNSIGKQPELLSRISLPQPEHMDYHTPTPSPTYTPPPNFTNTQPQSSSRRTLLQQLAGSDPGAMGGSSRCHTSTSQSNGSLASRIQTNFGLPIMAHRPTIRSSFTGLAAGDASLIPPVEVLPQLPDSSPATPASFAPTMELTSGHSPTSSLLINTPSARTSRIPTPIATAAMHAPGEPMSSSSFPVVDDRERSLGPPSAAIDSLAAQHERLQAISSNLANMALAPPLAPSHSPSPVPSSVLRTNDHSPSRQSNQSQHFAIPTVVRRPLSADQSSGQVDSSASNIQTYTGYSTALVPSVALVREYETQRSTLVEAVQNLNSALDTLHRLHVDSESVFIHQIRAFEEQRASFEHMKQVELAALQQQSQELRQKHDELNARESNLALLEKEIKTREDARKSVIAKRQAQEEEKRAAEAKRIQETQEQIDLAVKELMEVRALTQKARRQFGQLANEVVPNDVPTEPQEGMDKEEFATVQSRNDLLSDINRLRQLHMDKQQKLEESNRTLRRLEDVRKKRQAEEAERHRIAEEERLRELAEAEQTRQAQEEKRRQSEAERKRQVVAKGHQHASLAEQQARTEAHPHGPQRTGATSRQLMLEHRSYPEEVVESQQQTTADAAGIHATHGANFHSPAINSMDVDANERAFASHRNILLPEIHISPIGSQSAIPSSKQKNVPVSGGVMLTQKSPGSHLPLKPPAGLPLPSSDRARENTLNFPRTSPATSIPAEGGRSLSFPDQLASEFNRISHADIHSTPDHRPFPRTPKLQTILDATNGGGQELNIGPAPGVSPTHQNVNLRHLKRFRGRVEENGSGDRSVRTINVKNEEVEDQPRRVASPATTLPASLPLRPAVIPPPRPWMSKKRYAASKTQPNSTSASPLESNKNLIGEAVTTTDGQLWDVHPKGNPASQPVNVSVQQSVPTEISNSLLLGPVHAEPQSTGIHIDADRRPTQDTENRGTSSESATAPPPHGSEDVSRSNRRFTDEHRRARNGSAGRRAVDHYSPPSAAPRSAALSPTQSHRQMDTWFPPNSSNGPRAEPMRAGSPIAGRKRPSEFSDNEHGHRVRRQRDDVWVAQEHDRNRVELYRPHWDRRIESEVDERRTAYRSPPTPSDRIRSYPSDTARTTHDNWTHVAPPPEEPPRREQSHRRQEHEDTYQRYQPPAPGYNEQYHREDARLSRIHEPMAEERMDSQPEPPLLARMSSTQRLPPTTNSRGRGRGESTKARSDANRGRGRGNVTQRGGPTLIERLRNGPSSLGDRLT